MRRYLVAYVAWLAGVATMAAIGLAWYRHVAGIGLRELAARMAAEPGDDDGIARPAEWGHAG